VKVDLGVAIMIGIQVAHATFNLLFLGLLVKRIDKQNGRIDKLEEGRMEHLKECHMNGGREK
jgi:hypothetical protein